MRQLDQRAVGLEHDAAYLDAPPGEALHAQAGKSAFELGAPPRTVKSLRQSAPKFR
jgi:hypothetical protein